MKKMLFFAMCIFLCTSCDKEEYSRAQIKTDEFSECTWEWWEDEAAWCCTLGYITAIDLSITKNYAILVYAKSSNTYMQLPITLPFYQNISTTYMYMLESSGYLRIYSINSDNLQHIRPEITTFKIVVISEIPDKSNAIHNLSYEEVISKYKCKEYDIMVK